MTQRVAGCELCELSAPTVVDNDRFAVILVDDANYPGFARVIWKDHVREVSDLADADRLLLNDAVYRLELAVREVMQPLKVNVASLGNVVPHLHWHVIARFVWDSRFPQPVWAAARRSVEPPAEARLALPPAALDARVARAAAVAAGH